MRTLSRVGVRSIFLSVSSVVLLAAGRPAVAETLTGFGTGEFSIVPGAVIGLTYTQSDDSLTVSIGLGGTFGGAFEPGAFDWSAVTVFGLIMSVPGLDPGAGFTLDFFNSNVFDSSPANYYIARFSGTTAGVSDLPSILTLVKDSGFVPPEGGSGGLDNFADVAALQFTWDTAPEQGTSTSATLGGLAGMTGTANPVITSVGLSPAGFTMTWSGTGFLPVIVERRESLETGPWTAIAQGIATGAYTDPDPPPGQAFYRVVVP